MPLKRDGLDKTHAYVKESHQYIFKMFDPILIVLLVSCVSLNARYISLGGRYAVLVKVAGGSGLRSHCLQPNCLYRGNVSGGNKVLFSCQGHSCNVELTDITTSDTRVELNVYRAAVC